MRKWRQQVWMDSPLQEFCLKRHRKTHGESWQGMLVEGEFCFHKIGDGGACLPANGNDQ